MAELLTAQERTGDVDLTRGRWIDATTPRGENVTVDSFQARTGSRSITVTVESSADVGSPFYGLGNSSTGALLPGIPIAVGANFAVTGYGRKDPNAGGAHTYGGPALTFGNVYLRTSVIFRDAVGGLITVWPSSPSLVLVTTSAWTPFADLSGVVPVGAATAELVCNFEHQGTGPPFFNFAELAVGSRFYLDDLSFYVDQELFVAHPTGWAINTVLID